MPVASVALINQVADTTLATDLGRKATIYAAAGVPEYWLVDLGEDRVLHHAEPSADGYGEHADVPFGAMLFAVAVEGLEMASKDRNYFSCSDNYFSYLH